jgi:hypothetical protein
MAFCAYDRRGKRGKNGSWFLEFWCRYARPTRCSLGQTALRLGSSHLVPELFQAVDYKFEYGEDIIQPLTKSLREELEKF